MDLGLEGRVAIVTGAGRGLGRAIVLALVAEGVRVLAAARSLDELREVAETAADGAVETVRCDVADGAQLEGLVPRALERFGDLDVVVNNAGIAPAGEFLTQDPEIWRRAFEINALAPGLLARSAARHFVGKGAGKVINVASTTGVRGKPGLAAYSASKGALLRLTEALAAEWAVHGIQVNAIAPGAFATRAQQAVLDDPELHERRIRRIPQRRIAAPEEIGELASPRSAFVTGATFVIDGGEAGRL
jgi:2-deoxy-D-gluconate 3-dehydrogenase